MKNKKKRKKRFDKLITNTILLTENYPLNITLGGLCSSEVPCRNLKNCKELEDYDEKTTFVLARYTKIYSFR